MKERSHLEQSIDAIEKDRASYDKNIKELLADVQILARIIKYTVSEAEDLESNKGSNRESSRQIV